MPVTSFNFCLNAAGKIDFCINFDSARARERLVTRLDIFDLVPKECEPYKFF